MQKLIWKIEISQRTGVNLWETKSAAVDPWQLAAVQSLAQRLAPDGWRPATAEDDAMVAPGWAKIVHMRGETAAGRTDRYTVVGNVVLLDARGEVALYVELIAGKVEERRTAYDALAHVTPCPSGLRWVGGIVSSGADLRQRVAEVECDVAGRYRRFVPDTGWVQVPFYTRGGTVRMSETKIKEALRGEPLPQTPRGNRVKLQVKGRGGKWHAIQSRPVSMGATVLTVGPHAFTPSEGGDGYVYLTAVGAVEPTYRMEFNAYVALKEIKHVQKAVR